MRTKNANGKSRDLRLQSLLNLLVKSERVSVDELSEEFGVVPASIRRDLAALERQGLLRRDHGGAIRVEPLLYEPYARDSSFQEQVSRQAREKRRIGLAAAELIGEGETIAIGAGTTTSEVARSIPRHRTVRVFTNAVNIAMELSRRKNVSVILTGGEMRGAWFSLVGAEAVGAARRMTFDRVFIGANGVSAKVGVTDHHIDEAAVNRTYLAQGRQRILVADHTKFSQVATCVVAGPQGVDRIVTDLGVTAAHVSVFRKLGVEVTRV